MKIKPDWMPWNIWFPQQVESLRFRTIERIPCLFGNHIVKFDSHPYCYRCGIKPKKGR